MVNNFQFYKQLDSRDCGATCLRMIARHYGRYYSLESLRTMTHQNVQGVSLYGISDAAENIGMHTLGARMTYSRLIENLPLPGIVHWKNDHFVVLIKANKRHAWIADPADGIHKISRAAFLEGWVGDKDGYDKEGVVLLMEPTSDFYSRDGQKDNKGSLKYVWKNIIWYRGLVLKLILGVLLGSALLAVFPFVIQAVVDEGIDSQDYSLVLLILIAWLILYISKAGLDVIRNVILMHIGSKVNISLLTNFMIKILKLPISFFRKKMTEDIVQRVYDHARVERFLTNESLSVFYSISSLLFLSIVLGFFSKIALGVFLIANFFHVILVMLFLKRRKNLDYKRYDLTADTNHKLTDLVNGMEEIKLNNAEKKKRWDWEHAEAKLYRINKQYLITNDTPRIGAGFLNEIRNIFIIVFSAGAVIEGQITLGDLIAIMFIIAQLSAPVKEIIDFIFSAQDAKLSLERMNEIHEMKDEEDNPNKVDILPEGGNLRGERVTFNYDGPHAPTVLNQVNFEIPHGKTSAIIGPSGSGKTTLLKLILNFYQPKEGNVKLGDVSLNNLKVKLWRKKCGVVMQDGHIFSDSIAGNIALGDTFFDSSRLLNAAKVAHLQDWIDTLQLGFQTKVGAGGIGISKGQQQRILIARAIYKDPEYLFLDEATNDLDPETEDIVLKNIRRHFTGKTVIIIAHKLSTIIHADNIIMLKNGKVEEEGTHDELTIRRGTYYHWLKSQWQIRN